MENILHMDIKSKEWIYQWKISIFLKVDIEKS